MAKLLVVKLKNRISSLAVSYTTVKQEVDKLKNDNRRLINENQKLKEQCEQLQEENKGLNKFKELFDIVVRVFGKCNVDYAIEKEAERARLEAEEKAKRVSMQKPAHIFGRGKWIKNKLWF